MKRKISLAIFLFFLFFVFKSSKSTGLLEIQSRKEIEEERERRIENDDALNGAFEIQVRNQIETSTTSNDVLHGTLKTEITTDNLTGITDESIGNNTILQRILKGAGSHIQLQLIWKICLTVVLVALAVVAIISYFFCKRCKQHKDDLEAAEDSKDIAVNGAQTEGNKIPVTTEVKFEEESAKKVPERKEDKNESNILEAIASDEKREKKKAEHSEIKPSGKEESGKEAEITTLTNVKEKNMEEKIETVIEIEPNSKEENVEKDQEIKAESIKETSSDDKKETGEEKTAMNLAKKKKWKRPSWNLRKKMRKEQKAEHGETEPSGKEEPREKEEKNESEIKPNNKEENVGKAEEIMAKSIEETSTEDKETREKQSKYILPFAIKYKKDWLGRKRMKIRIWHV
ncbi:hypothetical protein XENTR_v10008230 [Xenopus tropicalis]|nr:hypothetical protein XENTR_v10008230 [Xenopus tropicalis]